MLTASDVSRAFLTWKKNIVSSKWLAQLKTRPARMITFSSDPSAPHSDMRCCLIMVTSPSVFTPVKNSLVTTATLEIRCNWQIICSTHGLRRIPDVFLHPLFCSVPPQAFLGKKNFNISIQLSKILRFCRIMTQRSCNTQLKLILFIELLK